MYKLFLSLRYLRKRVIVLFAMASVTLCVFMVLVVISVMGGFLEMVKERSRGLLSDVVVDNGSLQGFAYYDEFAQYLRTKMPQQIAAVTPVIYNYGILRVQETNYTKPVRVLGIHLEEYEQVNDFAGGLWYDRFYPGTTRLSPQLQPVSGFDQRGNRRLPPEFEVANERWRESADDDQVAKYDEFPYSPLPGERVFAQSFGPPAYLAGLDGESGELPGLIIGCDVINDRTDTGAYMRHYALGSPILLTLLPVTSGGRVSGEGAITLATRYADDSRTRVYEIDSICVYADFDMIQRTLRMDAQEKVDGGVTPARTSQLLIRLIDGVDAKQSRQRIEGVWQEFRDGLDIDPDSIDARLLDFVSIETWEERQRPFIQAVEKEKVLVTILFGVVSIVAIVLIGCIFYMVVEKKIRDIGILKSLGASSGGVAWIFIVYGAAVGVVGSALGTLGGVYFVRYINEIQDLLAKLDPALRVWSPEVYTFDRIPNIVDSTEAGVIVVVAIVASMLGALIPAILAARVWPVDALRYE